MATYTPIGLVLNGEELADVVNHLGIEVKSVSVEEIQAGNPFYREWLDEYGVSTYALTIEHDYDEDSLFSDPDQWQDAFAIYVAENYPEACIEDDGWLPNVVFHV